MLVNTAYKLPGYMLLVYLPVSGDGIHEINPSRCCGVPAFKKGFRSKGGNPVSESVGGVSLTSAVFRQLLRRCWCQAAWALAYSLDHISNAERGICYMDSFFSTSTLPRPALWRRRFTAMIQDGMAKSIGYN